MMDPELTHAITAIVTLLLGGGGVYGVQRLRNGNGESSGGGWSAAECNAKHDAIREDLAKDRGDLQDSIHNLTTTVEVGFETVNTKIATVARAERDAHEERYHPVGS